MARSLTIVLVRSMKDLNIVENRIEHLKKGNRELQVNKDINDNKQDIRKTTKIPISSRISLKA